MKEFVTLFGFTIGPIYEMMSYSKKTRELWFCSFFFSWYVKKFYEELDGTSGVVILSPNYDNKNPLLKSKAGLFPDHIVGGTDKNAEECMILLKTINSNISKFFIKEIDRVGTNYYLAGKNITQVEKIFNYYLQTSFVVLQAEGIDLKNVVGTIDNHLDALERNRSFVLGKNDVTCYRCKSLPSVFTITDNYDNKTKTQNVCPFCFIKFKSNESDEVCTESAQTKQFRYRSTGEISAYELFKNINENELKKYLKEYDEISFDPYTKEGKAFKKLLPEKSEEVKDYHKYMAIVVADGDDLGKLANNVDDPQRFSKTLFEFGRNATKITQDYHGEPIYLGGDDLLTFMPTAFIDNGSITTVIEYIRALSKNYSLTLSEMGLKGTMSFGVHLFYYKAPLSTALNDARYLLYEAKKSTMKNAVVLQLTQHSSQQVKVKFNLSSQTLIDFSNLLRNLLIGTIQYPEGIHHNLARFKTVLTNLQAPEQLDAFMINRFNEDIHEEYETGITAVFKILKEILTDNTKGEQHIYSGTQAVHLYNEFLSQIRFIKFLAGEK